MVVFPLLPCDAKHFGMGVAGCKLDFADDGDATAIGFCHQGGGVGDAGTFHNFIGIQNFAFGMSAFLPGKSVCIEEVFILLLDVSHVGYENFISLLLCQNGGSNTAFSSSQHCKFCHRFCFCVI